MKKNTIIIVLLGVILTSFVEDKVFLRDLLVHSYMTGYNKGTINMIKALYSNQDYNKQYDMDSLDYIDKVSSVNLKIVRE